MMLEVIRAHRSHQAGRLPILHSSENSEIVVGCVHGGQLVTDPYLQNRFSMHEGLAYLWAVIGAGQSSGTEKPQGWQRHKGALWRLHVDEEHREEPNGRRPRRAGVGDCHSNCAVHDGGSGHTVRECYGLLFSNTARLGAC